MTHPCSEREEQISMLLSNDLSDETRKDLEQHLGQCAACRDYLMAVREDDRRLIAFADQMSPVVARVEGRVLETVSRACLPKLEPTIQTTLLWRIITKNRFAGLAVAASVVLFVAIAVFLSGPKTLYAQTLKALEKARTVHAVGKDKRDGQWEQNAEVWYERGVGVVEQENVRGQIVTRIDNGQYQWRYTGGTSSAMKTKSPDPDAMGVVARLLNLREIQERFTGSPVGAKTVDGVECKVYSQSNPENTWRMDIWLDSDMRIRGWEKFRKTAGGDWEAYQTASVEYDLPIEKSRFAPDFGPGVTVIDTVVEGDKHWENRYDFRDALYTQEAFGLVFAVHQVKRCEGGLVFLVSSIRPTTETIRELGSIDSTRGAGSLVYGDFQLDSSWERLPDGTERLYQPWTLAELIHNGLQVKWSILIPKGSWPETVNECRLSAYIRTRSKLQEKLEKAGAEWNQRFRPLVTLPLPETTVSLSGVISSVYAEAQQIEPVAGHILLLRAGRPQTDPKIEGSWVTPLVKPSQIPPDQWEKECRTELERLRGR
jgi:outer membrane lipoprotein-sorting protein